MNDLDRAQLVGALLDAWENGRIEFAFRCGSDGLPNLHVRKIV